jgi:2-oxoglutarate ferredoxin oxidoreductase subunit beta
MNQLNLISHAENTWCPGCGNFVIQHTIKSVLLDLNQTGIPLEKVVLVAGIGQHGKTFDFMNLNGVYSLHGRTIPVATGIKLANPDLTVICVAGDGDCYAEGLEHLIFGAKRNVDITVLVHDNRVYGLTTGQFTPTSPHGFKGRSTPAGDVEYPINPLELMLSAGVTFIGRGYTHRREQLDLLLHEAITHPGFSFIDILQICATYNNLTSYYDERVYDWDSSEVYDHKAAYEKSREWDYNTDARIGLGIMYRRSAPSFEMSYPVPTALTQAERSEWIQTFIEKRR